MSTQIKNRTIGIGCLLTFLQLVFVFVSCATGDNSASNSEDDSDDSNTTGDSSQNDDAGFMTLCLERCENHGELCPDAAVECNESCMARQDMSPDECIHLGVAYYSCLSDDSLDCSDTYWEAGASWVSVSSPECASEFDAFSRCKSTDFIKKRIV